MSNTEKRRKYYENNKYDISKKILTVYLENSIKRVKLFWKRKYHKKINELETKVPYSHKKFGKSIFLALRNFGISKNHECCSDCISVAYDAYRYSIHRMSMYEEPTIEHIESYIKKMIRIYILCTIIVFNEKIQICKFHGLKLLNEDKKDSIY